MKKLIIAALLVVSVSSFAQENTGKKNKSDRGTREMKSPEERTEARLKKMTTELSLDANQQVEMKQIITEQNSKREAMRAERMLNKDRTKPSKEEYKAMKVKRDEESAAMDSRIKAVLNSTQYDKYKAMEEANKAKMREQMQRQARPEEN
jgi:protein CpxP